MTSFSSDNISQRTIQRRAVEAVIWGTPAVNFDRMFQAMVHDAKAGEGSNRIVYWSHLFNWKNQTLTPNPDSIYFMPFFNTKDVGPVVIEVPPADGGSITGSIDDCWQTAIADVGPAGTDQGKGGKYLLLPPGYKDKAPSGYIALETVNYQGYALLRSILKSNSEEDVEAAVAYGKHIEIYPLSQGAHPPETSFIDAIDVLYDATIPWDMRFFESLNRIVQTEPWLTRDKVMIDQLRSIGLEKGKPFNPDTATQEILKHAIAEAHAWLAHNYETRYFPPPFYPGGHWFVPASAEVARGMSTFFADPDSYPVDSRGTMYTLGFFSAKHFGAGQAYLRLSRTRTAINLTAAPPTASTFRPTRLSASTGPRPCTTATLMRSSATRRGQAALPRHRGCKRTPTAPSTSISDPKPRKARNPTGYPPAPAVASRRSSVFMDLRRLLPKRPGNCPT